MVNNPNFYGQSTTGTPNQIEDGVDFPHTGIIKGLSTGIGQNYAISGFNISSVTATSLTVADGVILRDGEKVSITGDVLTLSTTYTNGYHLLVAPTAGTVVLRNPTAVDKVAEFTTGDIIIGMITYTGNNPMTIQYLTVAKTQNSVSIAQPTTGSATYTEEGKISAPSGATVGEGIDIETVASNGDIRITPQGTGETVIKNIKATGDVLIPQYIKHDGDTDTYMRMQTDDIRFVAGNVEFIKMNENGASSELAIGDGATSIDVRMESDNENEMFFLDTSTDKIGIGTGSPQATLHVRANSDPAVRVQEDSQSGYIDIKAPSGSQGQIRHVNTNGAVIFDIDGISSGSNNQTIRFFRNGNSGAGTSKVIIYDSGVNSAKITFDDAGNADFTGNVEIDGDLNHDGSNVGFFGTAPAAKTSVSTLGTYAPHAPPSGDPHVLTNETRIIQLQGRLDDLITALSNLGLV
jgi:hypothetical protein